MSYSLTELLAKLGAPEVEETEHVRWSYFKTKNTEIAGFAEIRLEDDGQRLVAELRHWKQDTTGNHDPDTDRAWESFYLHAVRPTPDGRFTVTRLSFDDEDYTYPAKAIVELGASVFHARALEISIQMMEQAFRQQGKEKAPQTNRSTLATAMLGDRNVVPFASRVLYHQ